MDTQSVGCCGSAPEGPQQSIHPDRQHRPFRKRRRGTAAERSAKVTEETVEPGRAASRCSRGDWRQALGDGPSRTTRLGTAEAADPDMQLDRPPLGRKIENAAPE
jgi:hypothetical protein